MEILAQGWNTEKYTPFDPVSKRITAVIVNDGVTYTCAKGAPKAILNLSACSQETCRHVQCQGYRIRSTWFPFISVLRSRKVMKPWQLLGMLPMFDPPREDTAQPSWRLNSWVFR